MARDHFVYWSERVPTREQIGTVFRDYLGAFATEIKFEHGRWFAFLHGNDSWMFASEGDRFAGLEPDRRGIEIFIHEDCIDVITRRSDEATNDLAMGFAQHCARFWGGRLEAG